MNTVKEMQESLTPSKNCQGDSMAEYLSIRVSMGDEVAMVGRGQIKILNMLTAKGLRISFSDSESVMSLNQGNYMIQNEFKKKIFGCSMVKNEIRSKKKKNYVERQQYSQQDIFANETKTV